MLLQQAPCYRPGVIRAAAVALAGDLLAGLNAPNPRSEPAWRVGYIDAAVPGGGEAEVAAAATVATAGKGPQLTGCARR